MSYFELQEMYIDDLIQLFLTIKKRNRIKKEESIERLALLIQGIHTSDPKELILSLLDSISSKDDESNIDEIIGDKDGIERLKAYSMKGR